MTTPQKSGLSGTALELLLTNLLFIPPAAAVVTYRYLQLPYEYTSWIQFGWIFGIVLAVVVGWINNFPRWVYPYTLVLLGLVLALLAGSDSDMSVSENLTFKLMVIGPAVLLFNMMWLFFRKTHPARRWVENIRQDWTLISFGMYGLMALVIYSIFTDIRSLYGAPFLALAALVMMAGASTYLVVSNSHVQLFALGSGMTMTWLIAGLGSATYWHGRQAGWMQQPANGFAIFLQYVIVWGVMLAIISLPMLVTVIRRATIKT